MQRRTALDELGEGVPDWEDDNIDEAFPSLSQSASGNAVWASVAGSCGRFESCAKVPSQPEMNSMARHARGTRTEEVVE